LPYSTIATYANSPGMVMVNLLSVLKIAQAFEVSIEDLIEVLDDEDSK
jgi:putative transcriptional regulator